MHDQIKIVKLPAGRLKEVSRKTSRGVVENGRKLCQCNRCRVIERSGRAAAQDYLLGCVLRLFFFPAGAGGELPRPSERKMEGLVACRATDLLPPQTQADRKSTRLNSSHSQISYAVFCLKKK